MPISAATYPILDPASHIDASTAALRATQCALVVMAKAPRPGAVKTRLSPPLTLDQAAAFNVCFLRDTTESLKLATSHRNEAKAKSPSPLPADPAVGVISYTPIGEEALFEGLLPTGFMLIPQRGHNFGERLLFTAQDVLACGYGSVCLIDSDSPTVPTVAYRQAIEALHAPGDCRNRIVLGPSHDGGYYLIGLTHPHPEPFLDIAWSTATVAAETRDRCRDASLSLIELPLWYDVDDAATLALLRAELLHNTPPPFGAVAGYAAPHTQAFLHELQEQGSATP